MIKWQFIFNCSINFVVHFSVLVTIPISFKSGFPVPGLALKVFEVER
jgi:hypothetical protein